MRLDELLNGARVGRKERGPGMRSRSREMERSQQRLRSSEEQESQMWGSELSLSPCLRRGQVPTPVLVTYEISNLFSELILLGNL